MWNEPNNSVNLVAPKQMKWYSIYIWGKSTVHLRGVMKKKPTSKFPFYVALVSKIHNSIHLQPSNIHHVNTTVTRKIVPPLWYSVRYICMFNTKWMNRERKKQSKKSRNFPKWMDRLSASIHDIQLNSNWIGVWNTSEFDSMLFGGCMAGWQIIPTAEVSDRWDGLVYCLNKLAISNVAIYMAFYLLQLYAHLS